MGLHLDEDERDDPELFHEGDDPIAEQVPFEVLPLKSTRLAAITKHLQTYWILKEIELN